MTRGRHSRSVAGATAARASRAEYDVALVGDMTVPGDTALRIAGEAEMLARAGRTVALVHLTSAESAERISPDIQGVVSLGLADPVDPVVGLMVEEAIVYQLQCWERMPPRLRGLRAARVTALADRIPAFDAAATDRWLRALGPLSWAPTSPQIRSALAAGYPALVLHPEDRRPPPASNGPGRRAGGDGRLVIGAVGGAGIWPASPDVMASLFPTDGSVEVRLLGRPPAELTRFPHDDWHLIDPHAMSVGQFLRRLDVLACFPSDGGAPLDCIVAEALSLGLAVLMPSRLRDRFGEGPVFLDPGDCREALGRYVADPVIRRTVEANAKSAAERLREPAPAGRRRRAAQVPRRMLFLTSNGTGLGHVSRLLAIARRLEGIEPVFVTMAHAVDVIRDFGFAAEYLPSAAYAGTDPQQWDAWLRVELELLADTHNAVAIVYDGNGPSPGIVAAGGSRGRCGLAWIRGGMAGHAAVPHIENSLFFDLIIEPGELATDSDFGVTRRRRHEVDLVDPILLLEPDELLSRQAAAAALGLDPSRPAALIQLGAGSNRDIVAIIDRIVAHLADTPVQLALAEWSSASELPPLWPQIVVLRGHPLAQYWRAFDFTVAAAGYNTFHEVLAYRLPAIFIANSHPTMDDQRARARFAEARNLALALDEDDLGELPQMLDVMRSEEARRFLSDNCAGLGVGNGAASAARLLAERFG